MREAVPDPLPDGLKVYPILSNGLVPVIRQNREQGDYDQ